MPSHSIPSPASVDQVNPPWNASPLEFFFFFEAGNTFNLTKSETGFLNCSGIADASILRFGVSVHFPPKVTTHKFHNFIKFLLLVLPDS